MNVGWFCLLLKRLNKQKSYSIASVMGNHYLSDRIVR